MSDSFGDTNVFKIINMDDGYVEGRNQRYREAPDKLADALDDLSSRDGIITVVHLGDIINGGATEEKTIKEFDLICSIFEKYLDREKGTIHHVIGNHCLEVKRAPLMHRLNIPQPGYYVRQLPNNWRLIVLDTTEISGHSGFSAGSWQNEAAKEYQTRFPLNSENPQMASWNGGISSTQMEWLKNELEKAEKDGNRVIVASHHQVGEGGARSTHMAWNWKEIERVLLDSSCFRLALSGHDHMGGAALNKGAHGKMHFVTVEGLLEAPEGSNAYGVVQVFDDDIIRIVGYGTVTSRELAV